MHSETPIAGPAPATAHDDQPAASEPERAKVAGVREALHCLTSSLPGGKRKSPRSNTS